MYLQNRAHTSKQLMMLAAAAQKHVILHIASQGPSNAAEYLSTMNGLNDAAAYQKEQKAQGLFTCAT